MIKNLAIPAFLVILIHIYCFAQPSKQETWLNNAKQDSVRLQALYDFTWVRMINEPDSALIQARDLYNNAIKVKSQRFEAKGCLLIGMALVESNNYAEAEKYFNKSIELSKAIDDKATESLAYANLSGMLFRKGDLSLAFNISLTSVKLAEDSKNNQAISWANNTLACMYMDHKDSLKARNYFSKALVFAKLDKDTSLMAVTIGNIGNTYTNSNTSKMECYRQSLNWTRAVNNKKNEGYILRSIGDTHYLSQQYDSAVYYFNKSLKNASELNDSYQVSLSYGFLGTTYIARGQYKKAILMLNKCLEENKSINDVETYSEAYKYLYQAYKGLGNIHEALAAHEKFKLYQDSISSHDLSKLMTQKENESKFKREEERLKSIHDKQNAITEQRILKQKIIRNSLIAGSILLIFMIVILLNRNKLKRTIEIERMRSRLSRDLHDDIGSTLSSINILSHTAKNHLGDTNDEKTKATLEKINERSQRLLNSMRDIIWNINPENDTLEEVMSRMRDYASSLLEAKGIEYRFDFPKEMIDCKLSMDVKNNLYLIFKEGVNNLSKYSQCTHAVFSIMFDEKYIYLSIEDNGTGFRKEAIYHNGGLRNMQHRAEEIRGKLTIDSSPKQGTRIQLTIPHFS